MTDSNRLIWRCVSWCGHSAFRMLLGLCAATFITTAAFGQTGADRAEVRPNIILIMADDIGYECFGCYGSKQYETPNIDRLAREGMRFEHCYSQPLCTPSRIKLMTGLSNARNYVAFSILRKDQRTIGQYFRDAGYQTAVVGKWQLLGAKHYSEQFRSKGTWPEQCGFQKICLWQVDQLGSRYWNPLLYVDGKNREFGPDDYGPEVVTDYLLEFMSDHRDEPFFAYYPMILVHSPFQPTPDSASRESKDRQRNFEDMVRYMDKLVGRIVERTESLGIADRTLILFTGDNGTHTTIQSTLDGRTIRGGKGSTTDAGTRVPLVAYWPGVVPKGRVCEDLVDFSDFLPTVLEAAGIDVPSGLDGRSFWPQLTGASGNPRQWMYCFYCPRPERTPSVRFVRDRRWKLYGDGRFFAVENDVLEKQPLAVESLDAEAAAARKKLAAALKSMPDKGRMLLQFTPREQ